MTKRYSLIFSNFQGVKSCKKFEKRVKKLCEDAEKDSKLDDVENAQRKGKFECEQHFQIIDFIAQNLNREIAI